MKAPLNLEWDSANPPVEKLALQIIKDAIILGADSVLLELDLELHLEAEKEGDVIREKYRRPTFYEAIFKKRLKDYLRFQKTSYRELSVNRMFFELGQLPKAIKFTHTKSGVDEIMLPIYGCLFEDIKKVLLIAAGVTPKTSGEASGAFETIKPVSKWRFESKDLTRQLQLKRIRKA